MVRNKGTGVFSLEEGSKEGAFACAVSGQTARGGRRKEKVDTSGSNYVKEGCGK